MTLESIAQALGGRYERKANGGFMACCPAHEDKSPSLSLDGTADKLLFKCMAGCSQDAVVSALKTRGLFPGADRLPDLPPVKSKVVARYDYHDEAGSLLYWKERLEPGRGGRKKEFRFRHKDPATGENAFGHGKHNTHVLYNLPSVLTTKSILFVEGEKQVDLLKQWGLVATTTDAGASGKLTAEQVQQLTGKRIVILPDNDGAGREYARNIAAALYGHAEALKVVELPGLSDKCDIVDWAAAGGNKSALLALIKAAPEWEPIPEQGTVAETAPQGTSESVISDGWQEPQPIEAKMESLPYPLDALPESIRVAVEEVVAFVKAPIVLVASAALSAVSMAIQSRVDVARAEKLTGPCSLFLLSLAESGERKSTCDGFFTRAIRDYESKQAEDAKPDVKRFEAEQAAFDAKIRGITDSIRQAAKAGESTESIEADLLELQQKKPEPPRVPRVIYGDITPEALKYALAKQWPSGAVVSSEAGIVFGSHGMGKESAMRNLATLNQLWDGTDMPTERRSSESFTVRGARLTMALQVQESTLRAFFKASGELARGTGFLARFLIAWPESTQGNRPFTEAPENWPALAAFNKRISEILNQDILLTGDGALQPDLLNLSPEAKAAWIQFHDAIESGLHTGGALFDIRDVASKIADNAARLACLLHYFEHGKGDIGVDAFVSASRIAAWHLSEARRFFGGLALPVELADAARLDEWLLTYCHQHKTGEVPVSKVQQYGPCGLRAKVAIDGAMEELESLERARRVKDGKRRMIHLNPALLGGEI